MPGDPLIEEVARQLRRPVSLDPGLDARVMAEIGRARPPRRPLAWIGLALAAGLGLLAFFMGRTGRRPAADQGISFTLDAPGASRVTLVGDFNNWDPAATPLVRVSETGRWETVVPLTPGRYQFTFVVDGSQWVRDPLLPQATGDDFGQPTSVITVLSHRRS